MLALIDKIPSDKNKKVFVFSTSGMVSDKFNEFAKELLSKKEFNVVGSFACKGFDTFGPFKLVVRPSQPPLPSLGADGQPKA